MVMVTKKFKLVGRLGTTWVRMRHATPDRTFFAIEWSSGPDFETIGSMGFHHISGSPGEAFLSIVSQFKNGRTCVGVFPV